jgi:2-oxoglutarate ferredoxin oxidoreductase subunit delta
MKAERGAFVVQIDERLCKGTERCALCIWACPEEVIAPAERPGIRGVLAARVEREEACTGCGLCALYCPDLAIVVADREGVVVRV